MHVTVNGPAPAAYTPGAPSLKGHLMGVDTVLGAHDTTLSTHDTELAPKAGTVSGALTVAHHRGTYLTDGNITLPVTPGFRVRLRGGGAHDISAGGAALTIAAGDWVDIVVWDATTVEAIHTVAASITAIATS